MSWVSWGVSWISDYRRGQPDWYYRQNARARPETGPRRPKNTSPGPSAPPPPPNGETPGHSRPQRPGNAPPPKKGGLAGALEQVLPEGLDPGDLFLAAMLLFLYSESKDEDFLIILIVVGISLFHKDKDE